MCSVEKCGRPARTRGLCERHYRVLLRHGSPTGGGRPRGLSLSEAVDFYTPNRPIDGCWIWTGGTRHNYGSMKYKGKTVAAHRAAFEAANGYDPGFIRHTCDTPLCCRPDHLIPGDHASNAQDKVDRGRSARMPGSSNPNARHTPAEIETARDMIRTGYTNKQVIDATGLDKSLVSRLRHNRTWRNRLDIA